MNSITVTQSIDLHERREVLRQVLLLSGGLAAVSASLWISSNNAFAAEDERTIEEMMGDRILGDPDAPVLIEEYSSLTCPHCASFHEEKLPILKKKFIDTGKAKLINRDFPLDDRAAVATLMVRCAPADRYYPMLELLFKQQTNWARAENPLQALAQVGRFAGMSQERLEACFQNVDLYRAIVARRNQYGEERSIQSTPTFFVNGEQIQGNQPIEDFENAIESALQ